MKRVLYCASDILQRAQQELIQYVARVTKWKSLMIDWGYLRCTTKRIVTELRGKAG